MNEQTDLLARVRVASPCRVSWDGMEGDARVRFCRECNLNVYNLSEMTGAEAASLIAATEGRLCARFYRRADGKVLTRDCPKGLRAARLRVSRAAGAALAAVLSLFALAQGQTQKQKKSCPAGGDYTVETTTNANSFATVSGVVTDVMGTGLAGAEVTLTNKEKGQKYAARTSGEGEFTLAAVAPGAYVFEINAPGFRHFRRDDLSVGAGEAARVRVSVEVELMGEVVIIESPKHDVESKDGVTVFRGKALTSLPH